MCQVKLEQTIFTICFFFFSQEAWHFFLWQTILMECKALLRYMYMSQRMTIPAKWHVRPAKAWASAQSDQSLHCPHEESLGPSLPIERTAKTDQFRQMPRLICVFAGRTCHYLYVCHALAQILMLSVLQPKTDTFANSAILDEMFHNESSHLQCSSQAAPLRQWRMFSYFGAEKISSCAIVAQKIKKKKNTALCIFILAPAEVFRIATTNYIMPSDWIWRSNQRSCFMYWKHMVWCAVL